MGLLDDVIGFVKDVGDVGSNVAGFVNGLGINPIANYNADRDFSKSMDAQRALTQMSYILSQQNWDRQFDKESRYNLPVNEVMRLRDAGYNPYVKENTANGTMTMPAQSGSGSAASVNPVPNYVDRYSSAFLDSLRGINQNIVNQDTKQLINAQIQDLIAGAASKDASAQFAQIQADLEKRYGGLLKRRQINLLNAEIQKAYADAVKGEAEARYFDQAQFESLAKEALHKYLGKYYDKMSEVLDLDINSYADRLNHLFNLQDASTKAAKAQAFESQMQGEKAHEEALTENQMRSLRKTAQVLQNGLTGTEYLEKDKTMQSRIQREIQQNALIPEQIKNDLEMAKKQNNLVYWQFGVSALSSILQGVAMGAIGASSMVGAYSKMISAGVKPSMIPVGSKLFDAKGNPIITTTEVPKIGN